MALTEEEKEALDTVDGSTVYWKEFIEKWEVKKEHFVLNDCYNMPEDELDEKIKDLRKEAFAYKKQIQKEGFKAKLKAWGYNYHMDRYVVVVFGVKRRN